MSHAICAVPVAAIRSKSEHGAEMISQLLFGECAIITVVEKNWCKIVVKDDAYTGWCQLNQLLEIGEELFNAPRLFQAGAWVNEISWNGQLMKIPLGSALPALNNNVANWNNNIIQYRGDLWDLSEVVTSAKLMKGIALNYLNTSYTWGGRSVFGTDCSGFTQNIYKSVNILLHRDAHMQANQGELVGFIQQAHCGDLAFFDDEEGKIIHVGMLLNEHEIIHAAGKVSIDKIDNQGIINAITGERMQKLRLIKRYF